MQAAARPYPSPPHVPYQSVFPTSSDRELKRQYLTLLPPQQIIDICLTFDLHVPPYIKSTVWPLDINAAIAVLKKTPDSTSAKFVEPVDTAPVMDSLTSSTAGAHDHSPAEDQSTDKEVSVPPKPAISSELGSTNPASVDTQSQAQSSDSPSRSSPSQVSYAHQPYGYSPHAAYPHAPYYPHAPAGYPPYPHPAYHAYPPPPNGYPVPPASGYPPNSLLAGVALPHPSQPHDSYSTHAGDDLPSYEEMIVEALMESNDPEGCAPKDLFSWMASHYPLQSNFRPSASQALQKAYKRGRFEKSHGGKYRLSATWEGGNTSRRTTRRPQTQMQSAAASGSSLAPPFTQAPLVHHHHSHQPPGAHPPYSGQPYGYAYPPMPPGYSPYPQPPASPATGQLAQRTNQIQMHDSPSASGDGHRSARDKDARDAYEAAQNILRAINFGGLLQISNEEAANNETGSSTSVDTSSQPLATAAAEASVGLPTVMLSNVDAEGNAQGMRTGSTVTATALPTNTRAELQAQLALLAAQLAEIGEESTVADEDSSGEDMEAVVL
ncbi:hypothetical protein AX17_001878 [Amanita inopinata Kibby_2008]|nr:hypothetical protein AX17_001878 [Amanita inopinata Kibby_2008]